MKRKVNKIDVNIDTTDIEGKKKEWIHHYITLIKNSKNDESKIEEIIDKIYGDGFEDGYNECESEK